MGLGRPADPEHIGDTFLWMKRSAKAPNTFSQVIQGLEPGRQQVRIRPPPRRGESLAGEREQRLALVRIGDPVQRKQVGDINLPGSMSAKLDAADLRVRAANLLCGPLSRDPAGFAQAAQRRTEPDPQGHRSRRGGFSHGAAQTTAPRIGALYG